MFFFRTFKKISEMSICLTLGQDRFLLSALKCICLFIKRVYLSLYADNAYFIPILFLLKLKSANSVILTISNINEELETHIRSNIEKIKGKNYHSQTEVLERSGVQYCILYRKKRTELILHNKYVFTAW
jgi:hypothetical protein